MKIGLYVHWPLGSLDAKRGNVLGDELYAMSLTRALNAAGVSTELYGPNRLPSAPLDWLVHLNDTPPVRAMARRHMLYIQNAFGEGSDIKLRQLRAHGYDGYGFISQRLLDLHRNDGFEGIFLPFGVDTETFRPQPIDPTLAFEVAYVGNDIKGLSRSNAYLLPAADFHFGLYGNWSFSPGWRLWHHLRPRAPYQRRFAQLSRGRIPQEKVPALYCSAKINLNCTAQDCVDWDVITLRTLEVLACKGFLISDKVPSAEHLLKGCMVFTDGNDDLFNKIAYYLTHEGERKKIAQAGYDYVTQHASINATAGRLLAYLESL